MGMKKYIINRLFFTIFVVFGISIMVFFITHMIGNPVDMLLPLNATQEQRALMEQKLGLDQPLLVQLKDYLLNIVKLDFGTSWWQNVDCIDLILDVLPDTLILVAAAMVIACVVAIPLGILAAYRPGSFLDRLLSGASTVGICLPPFWIGLMLMLVFAVKLGWFYTSGSGTWRHLVLPAVTLACCPMGHLAQIVRFEMIQQLGSMYATTARAKGVSEMGVLFKHAFRNILTASITMIGADFIDLMAGTSATVETVFGWNGFGKLMTGTINNLDFPLLQAEVFFVSIMVCMVNLLVDILYAACDPRIRY